MTAVARHALPTAHHPHSSHSQYTGSG